MKIISNPGAVPLKITQIRNNANLITVARPGENVKMAVKCTPFEEDQILRGSVFCSSGSLCPVSSEIVGEIMVLQLLDSKPLFTAGFSCVFHSGTTQEECTVERLLNIIDPKTKLSKEKDPAFAKEKQIVQCRIRLKKPLCLEKIADYPQLGISRFTLRDEGRTIGFGKIVDLVAH